MKGPRRKKGLIENSLFAKNFIIYALVVLISFSVLGGAFVFQIQRFATAEKNAVLNQAASWAVKSTHSYLSVAPSLTGEPEKYFFEIYRLSMMQQADRANGMIYVADRSGRLQFIATGKGCYAQVSGYLPKEVIDQAAEKGLYTEMGTLSGYLSEPQYIVGKPVVDKAGQVDTVLFVATPADDSIQFFRDLMSIFVLMLVVVLLVTLLVTYLVVHNTVKPIKQIGQAAKNYARGDFSTRVALPKRQDELFDMARSFNNMADAVENMEDMRRGLVANVSHDLRTPMTTIAGFVDGILDGTIKPEKQSYYLHIISDEIKRLSRMANGMVEVSRLESGEKVLSNTVFDMSEMVRRIVIGFDQKLSEKKINMELDMPENANISADHDSIFQAVYNLIDNAVKYVDEGGSITVYMSTKTGKLQFNILNSGGEIAPEHLKHIFDRFYKADTSRGINKTGSGLGLYIVKTVINRHGGDVYAKSSEGKTEFCFHLPLNK